MQKSIGIWDVYLLGRRVNAMYYRDMNDIVREFWECSLKSDFSEFDWDEAFDEYLPFLERNLIVHGFMGEDAYREYLDDLYGALDANVGVDCPWMCFEGLKCVIGPEMVVDAIVAMHVEQLQYAYASSHGHLKELYDKVESRSSDERELITLFDECIHAQHLTGDILEDCDVDALRQEVEEERASHVTNMRDFL